MPLRLNLKPSETIYINGAIISNGDRATDIVIHNHCRLLRESEMITEAQATTPCSKIVLLLQNVHLDVDPDHALDDLARISAQILARMPEAGPYVSRIEKAIAEGQTYLALKHGRALAAHEAAQAPAARPAGAAGARRAARPAPPSGA
ncbi:flagellar biosynthesis repressor FlbT [Methylobacterium sp. WSM2598]|uniref:flagellar biosynthesis repressor FlbT n=1 Tax=Methylobacterium sp. WSM2598 TaxID=398261 RepID=UPI0009FF94DA|nr:flagellar biosynthesis repressor FlbT [Methylobacterium sp. WSM2598]